MPDDTILRVENLTYAFGSRRVLQGASLSVEPGRVTFLLGPNGAGKTTLFSLITGLLSPQAGKVTLPHKGRAGLAIVFQQPALDLDLTVKQNLQYHGGLFGLSVRETWRRAEPLLDKLELQARLADKVRTLNGGHRRRLEIVRALMTDPSLLLLDEPTAGLDAPTRLALVKFLHDMVVSRNLAVLWATHLTDEALPGDNVIVLHLGRVVVQGSIEHVVEQMGSTALDGAFAALTRETPT